ncbi:MAG: amidohydrolase, partial [Saprospiraceae bacterium]
MKCFPTLCFFILCSIANGFLYSQIQQAPQRSEGDGPYERLIIRGVTVINSTGAPPVGPVDIVVEKNIIKEIKSVGYPGAPVMDKDRPKAGAGDKVMDCQGMYILPGFVDMHGHIGGQSQGTPAEYVFKLWLGHGITTIRDPASGNGVKWTMEHKAKSLKNEIAAPRILCYPAFGSGWAKPISTPEEARLWVRENAKNGADGIKFFGAAPEIFKAALDENKKLGLKSACHHAQLEVG